MTVEERMRANRLWFANALRCVSMAVQECLAENRPRPRTDLVGLAAQYGKSCGLKRADFERFLQGGNLGDMLEIFDIKAGEYKPSGRRKKEPTDG